MGVQPGNPQRVVLTSTSAGAGHNQAAMALLAGLKDARPGLAVEFVDSLKFVPRWFGALYIGSYELGVTKLQGAYRWFYELLDRPRGPRRRLSERLRLRVEWRALRHYRRWLLQQRPVLVIATHYLVAPMVGRLVGRGTPGLRLMVTVTDNEAHRFWYAENVERYFAPNEVVRAQLGGWGVPEDHVTITGIPVHPKWTSPLDRQRIYRDWLLPADRPIVIVSGGTFFVVGPIREIVRGILDRTQAFVVVLAGANKDLLAAMAALPESGSRLLGVPFTDKGHELSEVASLMVTKAGGLMTTECLAKGLPMLLTKPVPGQEAANARLLVREGAALVAPTAEEVIAQVARLLADRAALEALRANARRLHKPGTPAIVEEILKAM